MTAPRDGLRRLGLSSATALVVANMIGAGVFTSSGFALDALGTPARVLAAWAVAGAIAVLGALCYGALARRLTESGGEYLFLSATLHPLAGSVAGWVSLLAGFTAPIALAAAALQSYIRPWVPSGVPTAAIGSGAIAVTALLHGVRLRDGVRTQDLAVAVKLAALVAFVGYGATLLPQPAEPPEPGELSVLSFAVSLTWISLAYSGWNAAVYVAGEVRDAERTVPRAMLIGTSITIVMYLLLNAVFVHAAPVESLRGKADIAAVAAGALGGTALEQMVRGTIALALFTSISSMVMAGPRVYAKMAADGVLPRWLARRGDVPASAVWTQAALAIGVLWITELRDLLGYLGYTLALGTAATVVGLMRLRHREGPVAVPVPCYPWLPLAFLAATLTTATLMTMERPVESAFGLGTVALALVLGALFRQRRSRRGPR